MRPALSLCILLLSAAGAGATDMGSAAANQVSLDQYRDYLRNWLYTRGSHSRGPFGAAHNLARDNIILLFQSFGLDVTVEQFYWSGGGTYYHNVVATKWGTLHPSRQYVIGAHYDSANTPGADDDASGVALALEAARILSPYTTDYTIRFVAFDLKEQGLLGSQAYVAAHAADNVLGMISADMVAWDSGTNQALIQGPSLAEALKRQLSAALAQYGGLSAVLQGDSLSSDHQRFGSAGIPACLLAERQAASNPYVHTQADTVDTANYINYPYAVNMTRGAVGFLADRAGASGLRFVYPQGRPIWLNPRGGTRLRVEVQSTGLTPQPGTGLLHYDLGGGFTTAPMTQTAPNAYEHGFPVLACGQSVSYRVTAATTGGLVMSSPAATRMHRAIAGLGGSVYLEDEFESNRGWTVSSTATAGRWQRGFPAGNGSYGDPTTDYDGSGQCYLTGNTPGESDVDSGRTYLISPTINLSAGDAEIRYGLWYTNNTGSNPNSDYFKTYISNNGGQSWVLAQTFGPVTAPGWTEQRFNAGQFVTPTSQVRVRFEAADLGGDSTVEAAIDGFMVVSYDCDGGCAGPADGDLNGDGVINGRDVQSFVEAVMQGPSAEAACRGDFTGDGVLDAGDIPGFVAALLVG